MGSPTELSRIVKVDPWPERGIVVDFVASAAEAAALARRFGLEAVHRFAANGRLERLDTMLVFRGMVKASVVQVCVVSLESFEATVEAAIERRFVKELPPPGDPDDPEGDVDLDLLERGEIDVGELAAEEFGLALDPYPRAPEAVAMTLSEGEPAAPANPFAKLKDL